ncbi:MAG: molybdenum cofactor guanylyltransferase [Sphingobacteriales bacterium]|nr:MAG: molybdenum cofactor guanylyltransferase [Sphingobacteriales bacterium]
MSKLYGLVVCGGKSSRMGTDKSMLDYHGQPQRYHLCDMLSSLCERVFISCNEQQSPSIPGQYAVVTDAPEYADAGPMTAVLSAFNAHPNADFLVVGCDYPFISKQDLLELFNVSYDALNTAAFYNSTFSCYEPLLAIYRSDARERLQDNFKRSRHSLSRFLLDIDASRIIPRKSETIKSVDTYEEYAEAKDIIENIDP